MSDPVVRRVKAGDGTGLNVRVRGEGHPVVFLHELLCGSGGFEPVIDLLERDWQCVSFDARGFPPSDVPDLPGAYSQDAAGSDLFDVMDQCGLDTAHVVGVSMGASAALHAALTVPRRVRTLTLVSIGTGSTSTPEQQAKSMEALAASFESKSPEELLPGFLTRPNRRTLADIPSARAIFEACFLALSPAGLAGTVRGALRNRPSLFTMSDELRDLQMPVLVICGSEDEPCLEPSRFLARTVPGAELDIFPGMGHGLYLENPEMLARACERIFQRSTVS